MSGESCEISNLARDLPDLPILLMTGYAEHRERAYGLEALIKGIVQKPFTLAHIREPVNRALGPKALGRLSSPASLDPGPFAL